VTLNQLNVVLLLYEYVTERRSKETALSNRSEKYDEEKNIVDDRQLIPNDKRLTLDDKQRMTNG
jgi:hypothetical protein